MAGDPALVGRRPLRIVREADVSVRRFRRLRFEHLVDGLVVRGVEAHGVEVEEELGAVWAVIGWGWAGRWNRVVTWFGRRMFGWPWW